MKSADCERLRQAVAGYRQPRPAAFVLGLPTTCACHRPGSGLPASHGPGPAAASQSAWSI